MKKNHFWRVFAQGCVLSLIAVSLTMCTTKPTWTADEEALITENPDTKMRLWTVDNEKDSVFLRQQCLPLTKEDITSPVFQHCGIFLLPKEILPSNHIRRTPHQFVIFFLIKTIKERRLFQTKPPLFFYSLTNVNTCC